MTWRAERTRQTGQAGLTWILGAASAAALLFMGGASAALGQTASEPPTLSYSVDLNDRADDMFHVRMAVSGLGPDNAILQFASTAPGTYQVMDIGRYVADLGAFDSDGTEVAVEQVSANQWRLADPAAVAEVRYSIAETWDTPVDEHPVYPMAGTSMEDDHVLINPHAVFPFPSGMQDAPIELRLEYPAEWKLGTALDASAEGVLLADDYDHFVDSPLLLGRLSYASTSVTGVPVEIYTYSVTDRIDSDQLLGAMDLVLQASGEFLGELPVDRYTFLFHFEGRNPSAGAWEHSYSSEYVLPEADLSDRYANMISDIAAHEFFHVVTPLHIHSEIIESFDFETPVPSEHLWLYEGVTEWASDAMQLRAGLKDPDRYLADQVQKIRSDEGFFDQDYSLSKLALTSYTAEGQRQYPNIYQRGAVVGALLDLRLLKLSGGEYGLQELLLDLAEQYGVSRPFPEDELFAIITEMTYPEIGEFFEAYVRGTEPLPIDEYYGWIGIELERREDGRAVRFVVDPEPSPEERALRDAWVSNP
jgi:predicted metalloprotease with PDZ domain